MQAPGRSPSGAAEELRCADLSGPHPVAWHLRGAWHASLAAQRAPPATVSGMAVQGLEGGAEGGPGGVAGSQADGDAAPSAFGGRDDAGGRGPQGEHGRGVAHGAAAAVVVPPSRREDLSGIRSVHEVASPGRESSTDRTGFRALGSAGHRGWDCSATTRCGWRTRRRCGASAPCSGRCGCWATG